jgi:hypothetical protein
MRYREDFRMSDTKFTKGPLVAVVDGAGSWGVEFDCGPWRDEEYLSFSTTSASNVDEDICTDDTAMANANLFATANEMYEMLDKIANATVYDRSYEAAKPIFDLLAKARGEE